MVKSSIWSIIQESWIKTINYRMFYLLEDYYYLNLLYLRVKTAASIRPPQNDLVSGTTSCPSWPFQRKIPCPVQKRARAGLNFCRGRSRSCRSQRTRSSLVSGRSSCPVVPYYKKVVPCTVSFWYPTYLAVARARSYLVPGRAWLLKAICLHIRGPT